MIALQITTGRGPTECEVALGHIVRKILAERPDAIIVRQSTQSAILTINGDRAEEFARSWTGTVLWVCAMRQRGRKNWYVGVESIELPDQDEIEIRDDDLKWETMRSSGKGGQHANKTDSAVRLIHLPTRITVIAEDERSQHRNKQIALSRLKDQLKEHLFLARIAIQTTNWMQHNQLERGNPVRTFEGKDFRERV